MSEWQLQDRKLKHYPHFDPFISAQDAKAYATNHAAVASHKFFPFIRYTDRFTRFAPAGEHGKSKPRPLRYAARRDAYIFAFYRHVLGELYEKALQDKSLGSSVLAYRRIPSSGGKGGKCNIHFAEEAFREIQKTGDCCVIALDIKDFFETLDHAQLKRLWCQLLGKAKLPADHFAVFKAITQYAVVDKEAVYERLGHFGAKRVTKNGDVIPGYLTPYRDIPRQLCTGKGFQEKIAGGSEKSIITKHYKSYGIPQGAPISDLLANLYLLEFDADANLMASELGGKYFRYSDDILFVLPGTAAVGLDFAEKIKTHIKKFGPKLTISDAKTSIVEYKVEGTTQVSKQVVGDKDARGIEYLGFRFSGKAVYIRNRTVQNLYRNVTSTARREANAFAKRFPDKSAAYLVANFKYEKFISRFGRVQDFGEKPGDYKSWTFWTYAIRAATYFGSLGQSIRRQLRSQRSIIRHKMEAEIVRAVARRDKSGAAKSRLIVKKKTGKAGKAK